MKAGSTSEKLNSEEEGQSHRSRNHKSLSSSHQPRNRQCKQKKSKVCFESCSLPGNMRADKWLLLYGFSHLCRRCGEGYSSRGTCPTLMLAKSVLNPAAQPDTPLPAMPLCASWVMALGEQASLGSFCCPRCWSMA